MHNNNPNQTDSCAAAAPRPAHIAAYLGAVISRIEGGANRLNTMRNLFQKVDEIVAKSNKNQLTGKAISDYGKAVGAFQELKAAYLFDTRFKNGAKVKLNKISEKLYPKYKGETFEQEIDIIGEFNGRKTFVEVKTQARVRNENIFSTEVGKDNRPVGQFIALFETAKQFDADLKYVVDYIHPRFSMKLRQLAEEYKVKLSIEIIG